MKKQLLLVIFLLPSFLFAQYTPDDVYNYIDKYHRMAVEMMKESKIPASIKLAQSIYSSGAGTTPLVKNSHNHFGILCGADWDGDSYADPSNQTCYRKYKTIEDSYQDHTNFLKGRSRYNRLFFLDILDYKAWANALQESGYSANTKYAQNIIEIIETYYLHIYDKEGITSGNTKPQTPAVATLSVTNMEREEREVEKKQELEQQKMVEERRKLEEQERETRLRLEKEKEEQLRLEQEKRAIEVEKTRIEQAWRDFDTKEKARMQTEKDEFETKIVKERKTFEEKQRIQHEVRKKALADSLKTDLPAGKPVIPKTENAPVVKKDTIIESGIEVIINKPVKKMENPKSEAVIPTLTPAKAVTPQEQKSEKVEALVFKAKEFEYKPVYYAFTTRNVYENNKAKFVIAQRGETFAKIAKDVQLSERQLRNHNDLFDNDTYEPAIGEVIYITAKNNKSFAQTHTIQKGETMRYIAQKYAVPLKTLYKRNGYSTDAFAEGKTICITCKK